MKSLRGMSGPDMGRKPKLHYGKEVRQVKVSVINSHEHKLRRLFMTNFLDGKKTYIVAFITAGLAVAQVFGIVVPEYIYTLLGAAGLGSLRVAVTK